MKIGIAITLNEKAYKLSTRKGVTRLYNALYDATDKLFKLYNPCQMFSGGCLLTKNIGKRYCCSGCKYLSESGCTERCLACKVHLCGTVNRLNLPKEFINQLTSINCIAHHLDMLWGRSSAKRSIEKSCIGISHIIGRRIK